MKKVLFLAAVCTSVSCAWTVGDLFDALGNEAGRLPALYGLTSGGCGEAEVIYVNKDDQEITKIIPMYGGSIVGCQMRYEDLTAHEIDPDTIRELKTPFGTYGQESVWRFIAK